jgi:4-amino-4-deoxy-L-arabinose transferase-like glycosyltransferase
VRDPADSLRRSLRGLLVLGLLGVGAELLLIGHDEEPKQLVPLLALGAALATLLWDALARSPASRRALRLAMLALVVSAAAGLYLHYESNQEFQRELDPELRGARLVWATLRAQSPPALAPAILALLGALGWISTRDPGPPEEPRRKTTT